MVGGGFETGSENYSSFNTRTYRLQVPVANLCEVMTWEGVLTQIQSERLGDFPSRSQGAASFLCHVFQ